jgi:hypothetical protein
VVAAGAGLLVGGGHGRATVTTVRGETVELFGEGLYRFDTLLGGSGYRGVDLAVLLVALPLLAGSLVLARRGSLRGRLLLVGTFAFFLYDYASLAFGAAYNELFLLYVVLFSTSLFGFLLAVATVDLAELDRAISPAMPRRAIAGVMFATLGVLAVVWVGPALAALLEGEPPAVLGTYTTMPTWVLDIGIILPAALIGGIFVLRRDPLGYLIASTTFVVTLMLGPALTLMTVSQLAAGVTFTPAEIVGPVAGFLVLAFVGMVAAVVLLRHVADGPRVDLRVAPSPA